LYNRIDHPTTRLDLQIEPNDYFTLEAARFIELEQQQQALPQHQEIHQQQQQALPQHQEVHQQQQQAPPQHQEIQQQQQQMHQVTTSQSHFQTLPTSTSAFTPILPVQPTPCNLPSMTTTFPDNNGQQAQNRNFRPLTPPLPVALPQPYQQLGSSTIQGLMLKIHLITRDEGNITQSTLMARKFYPATFSNRHLSNSFYTTLKDSYMANLRQTIPFKQLNQIGIRHKLRNMTSTYTTTDNVQHTLNLSTPLNPEEKMIAPSPFVQNNTDYGQIIDLNINFLLRLHKPPLEAYTLSLDDRNMMRSFLDQHRSRNFNLRTSSSPIRHRVGYQTQSFQRSRDVAAIRMALCEGQRRETTLRRHSPLGCPAPQEQRALTYHQNGSTS
jgi:hypothetical protein